jgi:hypothetical protein
MWGWFFLLLKTFLNKFYDEATVCARRKGLGFFGGKPVSAEDDNPPSPMTFVSSSSTPGSIGHHGPHSHGHHGMDSLGVGFGSGVKSSPFQQPPMTPPVSSNPHTPAPPASPAVSQMPPPGPSPAQMQGMGAPSSPFHPAASPMHGWPGSPSVVGPKGSPAAAGEFFQM